MSSDIPSKMSRSDPFISKLDNKYECDYVSMAKNNQSLSNRQLGAVICDMRPGATIQVHGLVNHKRGGIAKIEPTTLTIQFDFNKDADMDKEE